MVGIAPTSVSNKEVKQLQHLSQQQQALVPIAAFAATGDMMQLTPALKQGLEQGLSINEIKAVLVQTYAYAGFPRSLNALNAFMQLLEQRKAQGIHDLEGRNSQSLPQDYQAMKYGTDNQTKLVGQPVKGALFEFAPEIDEYLKTHLFGDIFSRDVLSWQDREIATVSMLSAMSGTAGQLKSHIVMSLNIGISYEQLQNIQQVLTHRVSSSAGEKLTQALK
ncbi:carboxymuconolactone decarboxylase family protein [Acinetobacter courvalinii]|uniref:carboxymuconolactone decarboxylase family protein n=1 Tax=Acinetobacter courvalinii TaxID=280147 RepID=UPI0021D1EB0C|nr:carboxymuconolactone decarboxylase family protein [Acinetobacter courvalinii]MCU4578444.1 carboxymuconolactone decarboxylase family protein [Acinetobacter courvalinii]